MLDEASFLSLLSKLIGDAEKLQDAPPALIPQETIAANHVLDVLRPFSVRPGLFPFVCLLYMLVLDASLLLRSFTLGSESLFVLMLHTTR